MAGCVGSCGFAVWFWVCSLVLVPPADASVFLPDGCCCASGRAKQIAVVLSGVEVTNVLGIDLGPRHRADREK